MHRKAPRSPEESLVCWAEWRKGFVLVRGEGKGQRRAAQGRCMSRVEPLTVSVHLASSRAFMLSRLGT